MRSVRLLSLLVLAASAGLVGCRSSPFTDDADALSQAEARWRASGIAAYEMTYRVACFCTPETSGPWTVRVEDGRVTRISGPTPGAQPPADPRTVAALFAEIREARRARADSVAVTYDPTDGHPVSLRIDRSFRMADEEVAYEVITFTRLR